jgi:3'-phosphoadenosine 5'-phosphosulfate sulfotransferase (PAPS reductase)/FAD synthetase
MITMPDKVKELADCGALFALNDSGGKDSQAMRIILAERIPATQLVTVHATLGDVEWPGALEHAAAGAEQDGIPFIVASASKTFLGMVENRHATRPEVPSWPSSSTRQCTSDLKRGPIERELRHELARRGLTKLVNCMGIRAEESSNRAKLMPLKRNERNSVAGRDWWDWLPIHSLTKDEVFETIARAGERPHKAYGLGNERLSCMFCIMGSKNDLRNAAIRNPDLYRRYVDLERRTGYTMHQSRLALPVLTGIPA